MHSPQLHDSLIHALATLPPAMNTKRLISLLSTGKIAPGDLAAFAWTAARIGQEKGPEVYRALISAKKPIDALVDVLVGAEFPQPPFAGTELLHPVTSRAHLQRIGDDFNNCLKHRYWASRAILKVINGARYFYEWRGDEPALLSFLQVQNVGWFLDEVEGANQDVVSEETRRDIMRAFAGAADLCPFQADKFFGWDQDSAFVESVIGSLS
jgi:hypothetical protein